MRGSKRILILAALPLIAIACGLPQSSEFEQISGDDVQFGLDQTTTTSTTTIPPTTIDATTLRFGTREAMTAGVGGTPEAHSRIHPEDSYEPDEVTRDGDTDAVVHARSDKLGVTKATTEVCVRGLTTTGLPFFGCDHVVVR